MIGAALGLLRALLGGPADRAAPPAPQPPPRHPPGWPDAGTLEAVLRGLGADRPGLWAPVLAPLCQRYRIDTPRRLAAFLPNVLHESAMLRRMVESLNYDPAGLAERWPKRFPPALAGRLGRVPGRPADQRAIAEVAYGKRMGNTEPGDGWRFRGRGLIQVTGREAYVAMAAATGRTLAELEGWLASPEGAAESAARWWAGKGLNALADTGDVAAVRRRVNGGENGLEEVEKLTRHALGLLAVEAAARAA